MRVVRLVQERLRSSRLAKRVLLRGFTVIQWLNHRRTGVIKSIGDVTYELDLNQLIDSSIYFLDAFEPETAGSINRLVSPGDIVLDVGANVGCHSLLISKLVGPSGLVIAFEPTGWAFRKLKRNKDLNTLFCSENLKLEKLVVADRTIERQRVKFKSSWVLFGPPLPAEEEIVDFVTIDDYVEKAGLARVDFIKIDVDGYESKVICGAMQTLRRYQPALILELGAYTIESVGDSLEEIVNCIFSLGYKIICDKNLHVFENTQEVLAAVPPDATINVICLKQGEDILNALINQPLRN